MTNFCMSPCSPDYILPFGRALVGLLFFCQALVVTPSTTLVIFIRSLHLWLGSVLTPYPVNGIVELFTEFTRLSWNAMPSKVTEKEKCLPTQRPWRATGQMFTCMICGEQFYRRASQIKRGITKTCGKRLCKSASMQGANNPFWGKNHSPEIVAHIEATKRARPIKSGENMVFRKGHKPTPEMRAAVSAATKRRWVENRDMMLSYIKPRLKPDSERRYRRNFSSVQCDEWTDSKCLWCDATDNLVLDHIIPVMCGGKNVKENAQTLCTPCNMWKLKFVDRPLLLAGLGKPEAEKL